MRHIHRLSPLLLLALAAGACQARDKQTFIDKFAGEPYTGPVKVRVTPPGGDAWRQYGEGSAHFVKKANGRAQFVVFGAIDDKKGDAGFSTEGVYDASGWWRSDVKGVRLQISPSGEISGGGTIPPQRFRFSGLASDSAIDLTVEIELLQATKKNMPKGTTFRFEYDLSRARADVRADNAKTAAAGGKKSGGKCRKIRYEMRPVPSMSGGAMDMIQVPVCVK